MSTIADLPSTALQLTGKGNALSGSVTGAGVIEESITWRCPWNASSQFFQAVIGSPETIPLGNGISITRTVPLRNPYNPNLFATGMTYDSIDGAARNATGGAYQDVIFKVKFSNALGGATSGFDGQGNPDPGNQVPTFCTISRRGAGKNVTDVGNAYTYGSGTKAKHDVGVYFAGGVYQIQLHMIPDIDAWQATVAPLENCVNSTAFNIGSFTRAPGTVLFESYEYDEEYDVQGNRKWSGTININCSSLLWNNIFVKGQQFALNPPPYQTADLNAIYY